MAKQGGITFYHPIAFWLGTAAIIAGVCAHFPMFFRMGYMNYAMVGMPMDPVMIAGMFMIVLGLLTAAYGLMPRLSVLRVRNKNVDEMQERFTIAAMDDVPLNKEHWKLFGILLVALIVDVMKPATLGFVVPGMRTEYEISKSLIVLLPFAALTGTAAGSIVWGLLADRLGRRAAILLASLIFIGTSICGAMPSYWWNVGMCFLMGMSAGGLLPITFALMAETIPARHRGWMLVLLGGLGSVGGYFVASICAAWLEPLFGWRVLWFLGLPTGLLLIILNRFIPESFRFLIHKGCVREASDMMRHFGARVVRKAPVPETAQLNAHADIGLGGLFRKPFGGVTVGLTGCGVAWGMLNFGFLLWLPSNLRDLGMSAATVSPILAKSALLSLPGVLLVTWLYYKWSTKYTIVLFSIFTSLVLMSFALFGAGIHISGIVLSALIVVLLIGSNSVIAVLMPYSSEIYPMHVRATGAGLAAASSKIGGILGVVLGLPVLAPGLVASAFAAAIPLGVAASILAFAGIETRQSRLEDIHARGEVRELIPVVNETTP